ncbi:MAG: serine hydrolase domain-containing protein, partial [Pirellulales bacterium]
QHVAADSPPVRDDAIFLIASPTKPVTALAMMLLVERGEIKLTDSIARYLPDFAGQGKRAISIAHCLTHTSGLPDMLPNNAELRAQSAPLDEFLRGVYQLKPDFAAGTRFQYQSMGSLVLSEVLHQVSGRRLADFLQDEIFTPLSMHDTVLGMPPEWEAAQGGESKQDRIAEVRLPGDAHSGVWNQAYWRRLGAPWGGLLSTPADWGKLCQHLLQIHAGQEGLLSRPTVVAMAANQFAQMPDMPEADRRCRPWGLGWRLNWPHDTQTFGDLLSPSAYGHWGATGTMVWIDPERDQFAVLLTTQPLTFNDSRHANFTNMVCAAAQVT